MNYFKVIAIYVSVFLTLVTAVRCEDKRPGDALAPVRKLLDQGKIEDAEAKLREYLKAHPDEFQARWLLGRVADFDGRPDDAIQAWRDGLKQKPEDYPLLMEIGRIEARQGHDGPTISYRRGTVTAHPSKDGVEEGKFKKEHLAQAAKAFQQAAALIPDRLEASFALAEAYSEAENHEAALKVWKELHESHRANAKVALGYANSLKASGKADESAKVLEKVIGLNPRLSEAHAALAEYYQDQGKADAAKASKQQAEFYEKLPAFSQLKYTAENAATLNKLFTAETVQALIADPSDRATEFLVVLCWSHPHNVLETRAFDSLEKRGDAAVPLVQEMMKDAQSTCTIRNSAHILARRKVPGILEELLRLLPGDTRSAFHMDIAGALGELGDVRAVEPLVTVLDPSSRAPDDTRAREFSLMDRDGARFRAAFALGMLDAAESRNALVAGLNHPKLAPYCAAALYRLTQDAKYVPSIRKAMTGDDSYMSYVMANYLRDMPSAEAKQLVADWDRAEAERNRDTTKKSKAQGQ